MNDSDDIGQKMWGWARELFPICRSITGDGLRRTLAYLAERLPQMRIHEVPSGTEVFDWTVPEEWNIRDAFIADERGRRIVDFGDNNLHVVGYSEPVDRWMDLEELDEHLHSLPDQPEAIPYITSYYRRRWGFCLSHNQRRRLKPGRYRAVIDSQLEPGSLTWGEVVLEGESQREVLLSTCVCHPSMANNELSGPVVTTALAQWLAGLERRRHTYRIVFIPETIGSLVVLARRLEHLKEHVVAGFNVICIGDERTYSFVPSRRGDTLADRAALHVLEQGTEQFERYSFLERGGDERQYCAPGVDLPVASVMRSKYGEYPEYHTSHDDLQLVTPRGLRGGYRAVRRALEILEQNRTYKTTVTGEPQLGRRGLYPTLSTKDTARQVRTMMNLIAYCDGTNTLLEVADTIDEPFWQLVPLVEQLVEHEVIEPVERHPRKH